MKNLELPAGLQLEIVDDSNLSLSAGTKLTLTKDTTLVAGAGDILTCTINDDPASEESKSGVSFSRCKIVTNY